MSERHDDALNRLHRYDPEYEKWGLDGLSNHAPMVAEALVALGLEDSVEPFLTAYEPRLRPLGAGSRVDDRAAALGDPRRVADWVAEYEAELASRPWPAVLAAAVEQLSDGVLASALHGWIRVAHAVRALERGDTSARRRELAHGLGLWAARYQPITRAIGTAPVAGRDAAQVLGAVQRLELPAGGLIFDRVRPVAQDAEFRDLLASWDPSTFELDAFVRAATAFGAERVIAVPGSRIAFVHVVTGASALRIVAPHLPAAAVRRLAGHLLEVVAALEAVYGGDVALESAPAPGVDALRDAARTTTDDHGVKLCETALREHKLSPSPLLLRAAATLLAVPSEGDAAPADPC